MTKILTIKLDVKKLDKARFFQGKPDKNGHAPLYCDLVLVERKEPGKYGDTHFIKQACSKEERLNKVEMPIIGSGKALSFGGGGTGEPPKASYAPPPERKQWPANTASPQNLDEDVPF